MLANTEGSLLENTEIIDVLSTIKTKSKEVGEKLTEAAEKKIEINEKRELFRPVAARGAVLYFCITEMIIVNWMYNSSLQQFLGLFDKSILTSKPSQMVKERVEIIIEALTNYVYRYVNRGLFEKDKITFKLMVSLKVLIKDGKLTPGDVNMLLKGGSGAVDPGSQRANWIDSKTWERIYHLSKHKFNGDPAYAFFKDITEIIKN